jgi:hypothetical protein
MKRKRKDGGLGKILILASVALPLPGKQVAGVRFGTSG